MCVLNINGYNKGFYKLIVLESKRILLIESDIEILK